MKCPYCSEIITEKDMDANVQKNQFYLSKSNVPLHLFWTCPKCGKIISITK